MDSVQNVGRKVIVADDDFTNRQLILDFLEDEGYQVSGFSLPDEIDVSALQDCDLVIMDVRFRTPEGVSQYGGLDYIIRRIRDATIKPDRPRVVFISRWGRDRQGVQERLQKINKYEWIDISTGLELVELWKCVRGAGAK